MGFVVMLIGAAMMIAGVVAPLGIIEKIILLAGGLVVLIVGAAAGFVGLYRKTSADQAFVRTGSGGAGAGSIGFGGSRCGRGVAIGLRPRLSAFGGGAF